MGIRNYLGTCLGGLENLFGREEPNHMRKQILASLIAAVALLFSVVALTSAPATANDYASYPAKNVTSPVVSGNTITGSADPGTMIDIVGPDGTTYSTTVGANGTYAITVMGSGSFAVFANGQLVGNVTVAAAPVANPTAVPTAVPAGTVVPAPAPAPAPSPGVVVTAASAGFTNGIPSQPGLAVTGSNSHILGFVATGLIALGAVAMGSRRQFLQGALED